MLVKCFNVKAGSALCSPLSGLLCCKSTSLVLQRAFCMFKMRRQAAHNHALSKHAFPHLNRMRQTSSTPSSPQLTSSPIALYFTRFPPLQRLLSRSQCTLLRCSRSRHAAAIPSFRASVPSVPLSIYPAPVTARNSAAAAAAAAATTTNISAADATAAAYAFFLLLRPAQLQLLLCTSAHARFMSATFMHGSPSSRMFDPLATLADCLIGAAAVRRMKAKRHPRCDVVHLGAHFSRRGRQKAVPEA